MNKEIRWKQRFSNFKNAFLKLKEATERTSASRLEEEGLIQRFEYTFELAWKTMKDFLEYSGVRASLPRDVIKEAFNKEIVSNGQAWIDMLEQRNVLAHTYDEANFETAIKLIRKEFFQEMTKLYEYLQGRLDES